MAEIEAPVVRVELFEDRAAVMRLTPSLQPGRHTLTIGPVTPLARGRAVSFPGTSGIVVEDVRVEREVITRRDADPEAVTELEAEWRTARDRQRVQADAARRAADRHERAKQAVSAAEEAAPRAFVESDQPTAWVSALRDLHKSLREARADAERLQLAVRRIDRETEVLRTRLEAARAGRPQVLAWLHLTVLAEEAGPLRVRYVVPCAVWRPIHRATLSTIDRGAEVDRVDWEIRAMCWNATGEDWTGVELVCSTARPGDHANPPVLLDDRVTSHRRELVVEARDEVVQVARESGARASEGVPGVDDGGEPRTFTASRPVDLPSDGHPVQVPLDAWSSDAQTAWQAFPERSSHVVLRSTQVNASARPLLAGPVELVRDGEAVGRAQIGLVPPGEPFSLGWGSHDGLRIVRRRDHEVERARLTGRQTHTFRVRLRVSHTGDEPVRVDLQERVPVSELKEVKVDGPSATPTLTERPDPDGRCGWTLDLQPGHTRELELTYNIDAGAKVQLPL